MFFIPGWLIELVTFPGVIVHEIAHRLFCHWAGVPVYQVRYFKPLGNPSGFVVHGHPQSLRAAFLISAGPLLVNTALCALFGTASAIPLFILGDADPHPAAGVLLWLGVSIGMHAFPSNHDAAEFAARVAESRGKRNALYFAARSFQGLLTVANVLRAVWFDAIYAIGVTILVPLLIVGA